MAYQILNLGHRGASFLAPENTHSSFRKALELGAHGFEFDIRTTRDRQIVVIHDPKINRTANQRGRVVLMSLNQLKEAEFGSWFHSEFTNEPLPTLREVLTLYPDAFLNIEIKSLGIEGKVIDILKENPHRRVLISSFYFSVLKKIRKLDPQIPTGFIIGRKLGLKGKILKAARLGCFSFHPEQGLLTPQMVSLCQSLNLKMIPWADSQCHEGRIKQLFEMGIHGLISDHPGLITHHLEKNPQGNWESPWK